MSDRMRLLITAPWADRLGGAEEMMWSILNHLDRDRIDPAVAFMEEGPFEREVASLGVTTLAIPAGRLRDPRGTTRAVRRLGGLMRRLHPDVILNWSAKTQLYGGAAARIAGLADRVVWWQHSVPTGHWMDRLATALPAAAVGCSSKASLEAQLRLRPRRRSFVVNPGVEPRSRLSAPEAADLRRALGIPSARTVVGILGRLQPWKGQDRLIRAIAILRERGHDVHCLVVGGNAYDLAPRYEHRLRELVTELDLGDRVTMTGQVDDPDRYVSLMDVFVNASDHEPFGIVLLEAMALEVPVVAPATAGPLEILEPDTSGVLVRSPAPLELAGGVERLLVDPDWRRIVAANGHRRCMSRFSARATADRLAESLAEIARA